MRLRTLALAAGLLLTTAAFAEDKVPLTATLTSNKESYALDPAQTGDAFNASLKEPRGRKPAASKVDLTFKITNNSDTEKKLNIGGDSSRFEFTLEGPGAVTVENMVMMTREFRMGEEVTIAPGKSHEIKLSSLAGGMRGMTKLSYFTEAGDYKLSATLIANVGETQLKIATDAITIKITKPEEKK
jgi:hypothetical protein